MSNLHPHALSEINLQRCAQGAWCAQRALAIAGSRVATLAARCDVGPVLLIRHVIHGQIPGCCTTHHDGLIARAQIQCGVTIDPHRVRVVARTVLHIGDVAIDRQPWYCRDAVVEQNAADELGQTQYLLVAGAALGLGAAMWSALGVNEAVNKYGDAIAVVDGVPIPRAVYDTAVAGLASAKRNPLTETEKREALDRIIDEELLLRRAVELGLAESDPASHT